MKTIINEDYFKIIGLSDIKLVDFPYPSDSLKEEREKVLESELELGLLEKLTGIEGYHHDFELYRDKVNNEIYALVKYNGDNEIILSNGKSYKKGEHIWLTTHMSTAIVTQNENKIIPINETIPVTQIDCTTSSTNDFQKTDLYQFISSYLIPSSSSDNEQERQYRK